MKVELLEDQGHSVSETDMLTFRHVDTSVMMMTMMMMMIQTVQGRMKVKLLGQGHAHCRLRELGILTYTNLERQGQMKVKELADKGHDDYDDVDVPDSSRSYEGQSTRSRSRSPSPTRTQDPNIY